MLLKNWVILYPEKLYKLLWGPIWLMGISYLTDETMKTFIVNLKLLSTMQHWTLLGQFREHQKVKLYKELGRESLISRRWFRYICCFYNIKTFGLPSYLSNLISSLVTLWTQRMLSHIIQNWHIQTFKESRYSHLIFRYGACFEQGVPWHSGNCRVWIHSQTRTWHDKNIQSNAPYR